MEHHIAHLPEYLADATHENPQRRAEGALRVSRHLLGVDALALTLITPADQKPQLIAQDGYLPGVANVYTADWFGVTPRRLHRYRENPKRLYPWERSEFAETKYVHETLMPAGYRNGLTHPLTTPEGVIFGFIHTNITRSTFHAESQELLLRTAEHIVRTAWVLRERMSASLTAREEEILTLLRQGCSTPEISENLFISRHTVATHIEHILQKTGSTNRVQAAIWAVRHGL